MLRRWGWLLLVGIVLGVFAPKRLFAEGGLLALDPKFFEGRPSLLSEAEPGEITCTTVDGKSQSAMNAKVAKEVRSYCAGDLTIEYIQPRKKFVSLGAYYTQEDGYTRICCRIKGQSRGSRTRRFQQP